MATQPLTDEAIATALEGLPGWERTGDSITRTFKLPSYAAGLMFAAAVGALAEGYDHHPDLFIGYKTVRVTFSTHDAGNKISQKDIDIAAAINALPYPKS
ncbi:MAG: 4a-hydroxytetrahydrobiopterin dehydratase [Anaerolineae bacterium]